MSFLQTLALNTLTTRRCKNIQTNLLSFQVPFGRSFAFWIKVCDFLNENFKKER
jgi:hypothetical protein